MVVVPDTVEIDIGPLDTRLIELNRWACEPIKSPKELVIIEGASHLFKKPRTLDEVQHHAMGWFLYHLAGDGGA
jgi:putative phosphoribosyl transferase